MIRHYGMVRAVAGEISDAVNGTLAGYASGEDVHEPDITAQMVGAIHERMRNWKFDGVLWNSHILTSGGRGAEEKRYGADLMGVLDISLPDYNTKKGFLVQAKRAEPGVQFRKEDWDRLISQCERMLDITPDSFVFVYSRSKSVSKRIRIFSASAVRGSRSRSIFNLYHRGIKQFFVDHLECFIGDTRIDSPDTQILGALTDSHAGLADRPVRNVLHLRARLSE